MNSRYIMFLGVAVLLVSIHTSAQIRMEPPAPVHVQKPTTEEEKAREQTRWMNKNLDLELNQFMKVNNINLTYARKMDSVDKISDKHIKGDFKAEMKSNRDAEIKTVLNDQQYKQYLAHKDKPSTAQKKSPFSGTY